MKLPWCGAVLRATRGRVKAQAQRVGCNGSCRWPCIAQALTPYARAARITLHRWLLMRRKRKRL